MFLSGERDSIWTLYGTLSLPPRGVCVIYIYIFFFFIKAVIMKAEHDSRTFGFSHRATFKVSARRHAETLTLTLRRMFRLKFSVNPSGFSPPAPTLGTQYAFIIINIFDYNYAETSTWLFGFFFFFLLVHFL